jgi:hypothetical protein
MKNKNADSKSNTTLAGGGSKRLLGTVLYQICAKGIYKVVECKAHYYSKDVYINKPSQKEIDKFIDRCCNNKHPNNLWDLDKDTVKISLIELMLR